MTQKRILSLLVSASLLCGLLAGCSNTNGDASHASSSASEPSSVSSESAPSSTAQADTSGLFNKDFDENSLFSVDGTAAAFEPSLGWGPGVSGCSLKSVQAAATLLVWADEANLSARTETAIEDAYTQWYDNLSDSEQEGFAALAARFRMVGAIEKMHEERYRELLRDVQAQAVFEKSSVKVWECRNCGHIVVGTSAPKVCPACHYPQGYYEVREDVRGA